MKLALNLSTLAGLALIAIVLADVSPANAAVDYVQICDVLGPGWFYVPGSATNCVNAVTREVRDSTTGQVLDPGGANHAVEEDAIALALPTPVIEHGDRFAIAGNFAEYEGFGAFGLAGAFRLTNNANFEAAFGYGYMMGTFAARLGLNVSLGDGTTPPPVDDSSDRRRSIPGFSSNFAVFGGLMQFDYPLGDTTRSYDRDWIFGGLGRAAVRNTRGLGAQFDLWSNVYRPYLFEGGQYRGDTPPTTAVGAALHLNQRFNDTIAGGFVSLGARNDRDHFFSTVGLEARTTLGRFSFYTQAGYAFDVEELIYPPHHTTSYGSSIPENGVVYGHVSGAYFPLPNLMIEANGGVAYGPDYRGSIFATYPDNNTIWYRWGAQLEYRPDNKPFSMFAEYQGLEQLAPFAPGFGARYMENRVLAGLRFFQNDTTLLDNTANGASLTDYNPVYGVNRSVE